MREDAESFLGDVLADRPRESYVLATKVYFPMDDSGDNEGLSRPQILKQIDASRGRRSRRVRSPASIGGGNPRPTARARRANGWGG